MEWFWQVPVSLGAKGSDLDPLPPHGIKSNVVYYILDTNKLKEILSTNYSRLSLNNWSDKVGWKYDFSPIQILPTRLCISPVVDGRARNSYTRKEYLKDKSQNHSEFERQDFYLRKFQTPKVFFPWKIIIQSLYNRIFISGIFIPLRYSSDKNLLNGLVS